MVQAMKIHWNYGNQKCHNLDEISVSGCTQSCFDNFQYSQKFGQHDDISISVLTHCGPVTLYVDTALG